ncbi:polyprenyl synthetase family protein [Gracilibacillus caseinilyticus]|uniref:Polyprenyl synthetase family protein n=1 Tax=Gracilibacillus caseinilyticus TaxID=2932256 RepID=A0ABY4ET16_9BACI|nr:farnesyl diphosphate synthase [Gracilibacillus caseinilyticus]UOQ47490.1 polyprenyl synthetase family protein [Gracilibacillus caseinilyticus]
MQRSIDDILKSEQDNINNTLLKYIHQLEVPARLKESVLYSIEAGGKRLRPLLMKLTCEGLGGEVDKVYPAAVALEMIHTYSLIHDDLPAMDDDMYRRGKLTNHKKYDEATAILAGDGLLTNSFHLISTTKAYTDVQKVKVITALSKASGLEGMVAGQYLDMEAENKLVSVTALEHIHHLKTGRLISSAIEIGAYLADVTEEKREIMKRFGDCLGLIFQIQDDILDVEGDQELIGKRVGSDIDNDKSTYPGLLGIEGAKQYKARLMVEAADCLQETGLENTDLAVISTYLSERDQ